ncbi:hypothetical protein BDW22DRAFT_1424764 [Trametopsis cervina]|nr:hypothetical protein BDW22DRAFT_1424764 [Trametopsis cervina]
MSPKLYTFGLSIWGALAELAAEELEVPVELVQVAVANGENFNPEFLKLNPEGTVPTLVTEDGKKYTSSTDVVKYLLSVTSKKTTPGNPEIYNKVHEPSIDPNFILLATRNDEEFVKAQNGLATAFVSGRKAALEKYSAAPDAAPFLEFYTNKLVGVNHLAKLFGGEVPTADWYALSTKHWGDIATFINVDLPALLPESGFIDGAEPGEDDFHVGAWLTRVSWVAGATNDPEGLKPIEKELGGPVPAKVVAYWKAWQKRPSFQKVYKQTLH